MTTTCPSIPAIGPVIDPPESGPGPWPRSDCLELAAHPAAAASARLRTRLALRAWNLDELADDAELVVDELVVNAIAAHRRENLDRPVRVTLLAGLRTVLVIVRDASGAGPVPGDPGADDEHGRGLIIVEALSVWRDTKAIPGDGKVVRCLLRGTVARKDCPIP